MHLRQLAALNKSRFTYSAWEPFTKNKERIQKFMETRNSQYICQKKLACLQHDIAYGDFKDLTRFKCLLHY